MSCFQLKCGHFYIVMKLWSLFKPPPFHGFHCYPFCRREGELPWYYHGEVWVQIPHSASVDSWKFLVIAGCGGSASSSSSLHWYYKAGGLVTTGWWWQSSLTIGLPLTPPPAGREAVPHYCQVGLDVQAPHVVSTDTISLDGAHYWLLGWESWLPTEPSLTPTCQEEVPYYNLSKVKT